MASNSSVQMSRMSLRRRLLQDIAELQTDPYPNIILCPWDADLQEACLLLTPTGKRPIHLTVVFGDEYPIKAPRISIESKVDHPNVYGSYICASILNTTEGYTPAYTLKGIAIQILSFFSSERLEQTDGTYSEVPDTYRRSTKPWDAFATRTWRGEERSYSCGKCGFGGKRIGDSDLVIVGNRALKDPFIGNKDAVAVNPKLPQEEIGSHNHDTMDINERLPDSMFSKPTLIDRLTALPDEVVMLVFQDLDSKDMLALASISTRLAMFMNSYDTIRMRETQCFLLKENFLGSKLGVGVHVARSGRKQGMLESEFDLVSLEAYDQYKVRHSIHGLPFHHWLPLPISHRHWRSVRPDVRISLFNLACAANVPNKSETRIEVIYSFMNDVVVKLSREAEQSWGINAKSTLTHASEKAVDSYFGLFHLLLCLATEQRQIVQEANELLERFMKGYTTKDDCPNLGELLVAVLISDEGLTEDLAKKIIEEAVLRNVVWMLDPKGAGMAELVYTELDAISEYRLQRTFDGSKISYRLLMFLALFCKTARIPGKSISDIRDEMFERHGAPPRDTAEQMAADIRQIRSVHNFHDFFKAMGLQNIPSKEDWCAFLKTTIDGSVRARYSRHALSQDKAYALRKTLEPNVGVKKGINLQTKAPTVNNVSFFPLKGKKGGGGRR